MKNKIFSIHVIVFFLLFYGISIGQEANWKNLFNGSDLEGWHVKNGTAPYTVENGEIVGTTVANSPNTFLCTDQTFSDFILEFEINGDNEINSGVQFRSLSNPDYQNGRVHGYQCEIDPSPRAFSGGIYDEGRRKWLYSPTRNDKARKAYRTGEWNHVRIEAIGQNLRTYINGVMISNLVDDLTAEGFIGLQVHSIRDAELAGREIRWRNIRILTDNPGMYAKSVDPMAPEISFLTNKLSADEMRKGWRLLWDGQSSEGWRGAKLDAFPTDGWTIADGILTIEKTDGGEATGPGDIITVDKFSNFELELEFKITEGANSGIKYFVDPGLNKGAGSSIGCEFQILDDKVHPDAKKGVRSNRTLGSLYDLIAAKNLSYDGTKRFNGIGEWNKARIVSNNGKVEHWLNNELVVTYDRYSQIFEALVNYSKYKDWPNFGRFPEGHILLQDHGDTVHYRSIKIREF